MSDNLLYTVYTVLRTLYIFRQMEGHSADGMIIIQEVLGRTNRLLSFDTSRTADKTKKLNGVG
jgi:hypothetical protein